MDTKDEQYKYKDIDILRMFYFCTLEDLKQNEIDEILLKLFKSEIDIDNEQDLNRFIDLSKDYSKR